MSASAAAVSGGVPVVTNEFWTARSGPAHSLHEISHCAKTKYRMLSTSALMRLLAEAPQ
jgi:hypothetical protein